MSGSDRPTRTADRAKAVGHLDPAQRAALGRAARAAVPRSAHAEWAAGTKRADPVTLLRAQEATRVPELVPLRHERMLESPFTFYRGAAVVMAADLATLPNSGLRVQACGDAHLSNFGGFAAPDRSMVFDMNDFDETVPGPFEWDVKRLAASFEIAARSREFPSKTARTVVRRVARSYREAMAQFATMTNLDVWYSRLDAQGVLDRWRSQVSRDDVKRFERTVAKAERKDSLKAQSRLTHLVDGAYRIVSDPPTLMPVTDLAGDIDAELVQAWLHERYRVYRRSLQHDRRHLLDGYRLVDFAAEGRGCRERGDAVLDRALAREGRRRSALPAGQGS